MLFLIIISPSRQIGILKVKQLKARIDVPGEFIIQNKTNPTFLHGMRMTTTDNKKALVGGLPLNPTGRSYLFEITKRESKLFSHPIFEAQFQPIIFGKTSQPPLDLRLPTSVLKKVSYKSKSEKWDEERHNEELFFFDDGTRLNGCFKFPLRSKMTSSFAEARRLPTQESYRHPGIDLRALKGTPVRASATGTVVFAGEMKTPGKNIVLHHGSGIFTRYMHLSDLNVHQGQVVNIGEIIGLSGDSGRAQAPHLHWETLWKGRPVNPLQFLERWGPFCHSL